MPSTSSSAGNYPWTEPGGLATSRPPGMPSPSREVAAHAAQRATPSNEARRARLERVQRLAKFLDTSITIPGIGVRLGADAVFGLVPGVGDVVSMILSGFIVREAYQAGASYGVLGRMVKNLAIDALIGIIPLAGDVFDVFFRANARNARLLADELERQQKAERTASATSTDRSRSDTR